MKTIGLKMSENEIAGIGQTKFKTIVNKNIKDVIDPFPDIFDNFDSLFIYFF